MRKKYKLTRETKKFLDGTVLHRIRAVRDFVLADGTKIRAGDLGGWIECEENLSHGGSAWVGDEALIFNKAWVGDDARVCDDARVYGNARIGGKVRVYGQAWIYGKTWINGGVQIGGKGEVFGNARIYGNARICNIHDYAVFKNTWSSGRYFTYTSSNKMWKVGCFYGTGEELIAKAYGDSKLSGRCYEAIVCAQEAVDRAVEEEVKVK